MSDTTDLRAKVGAVPDETLPVAAPEYFEFEKLDPSETSAAGSRTWLVRAQNLTLAYSKMTADDPLERVDQPHEYMVVLPFAGSSMTVESEHGDGTVAGPALAIIPAGSSTVTVDSDTELFRLFDSRTTDLADAALNAASYATPHPYVALLEPWPDPPAGPKLRLYPLGDIPQDPARFGRLFRSSAFMINAFYPSSKPRPTNRLSPHHHDDFEQIGLALTGSVIHHIRTPWGRDLAHWREDEHQPLEAPCMVIIPPPTVHTTQSTSKGEYVHFDIFSPPRADFSARPGWVLNADEYPAPEGLEG